MPGGIHAALPKGHFPTTVFVRCHKCGKGITGSFSTGKLRKKYPGYACRTKGCRGFKMRRERLHIEFSDLREGMAPSAKAMGILPVILEQLWLERQSAIRDLQAKIDGNVAKLETRKQEIFDFFMDRKISQDVYQLQTEKVDSALAEARTLGSDSLVDSDEFQIHSLVDFGTWMLTNAADLWFSASADAKRKFQNALFPTGVVGGSDGVGNPSTPYIYRCFNAVDK
jgi:hypothetical protein